MAGDRYLTQDQDTIRSWAEQRDGTPAEQSNFNKLVNADTAEEAAENAEWRGGSAGGSSGSRSSSGSSRSSSGGGTRINLNRATAEELDSMFGVGPATARRIIEYRDKELGGTFHDVHDLTHINGVGEETARTIARAASFE